MTAERAPAVTGAAKLLVAIFDQRDEWQGEPLHEALIRVLEAQGIAGVTVLTGITGYGSNRRIHLKGLIGLPHDKPSILLIIDHEPKLRAALAVVRPMIEEGIVVLIDAEVIPFA